nr:hypothetical protein GCM10020093_038160 [Planobispora longispora]
MTHHTDVRQAAEDGGGFLLRTRRYRWVILGVATLTQATSGFFVQGIGAMSAHLQRDLHLSTAQLGLLLSAAQLVPLIGLSVAGELLDRHNERWVVGIGACVVAVSLGAGSMASGYASLLLVLLIVGAGYSTVQPGGSKSVASWFDASQRGLAMGVRQAGLPLGGVLAAAVLPSSPRLSAGGRRSWPEASSRCWEPSSSCASTVGHRPKALLGTAFLGMAFLGTAPPGTRSRVPRARPGSAPGCGCSANRPW